MTAECSLSCVTHPLGQTGPTGTVVPTSMLAGWTSHVGNPLGAGVKKSSLPKVLPLLL